MPSLVAGAPRPSEKGVHTRATKFVTMGTRCLKQRGRALQSTRGVGMERVAPRLEQVSEHLWVVSLEGEYDLANVDQVDEALDKAFNAGSTVILDLQDVTFIDSMVMDVIA